MQNFIISDGGKYVSQKALIIALYDYCVSHRNPKTFYLSRTFEVLETVSGKFYEVSLTFDKSEILTSIKFKEITVNHNRPKLYHPYTLFATNYVDCEGIYFDTNTQVVEYLKRHEGQKFTLQVNNGERCWTWFEDGLLWYDGKSQVLKK